MTNSKIEDEKKVCLCPPKSFFLKNPFHLTRCLFRWKMKEDDLTDSKIEFDEKVYLIPFVH